MTLETLTPYGQVWTAPEKRRPDPAIAAAAAALAATFADSHLKLVDRFCRGSSLDRRFTIRRLVALPVSVISLAGRGLLRGRTSDVSMEGATLLLPEDPPPSNLTVVIGFLSRDLKAPQVMTFQAKKCYSVLSSTDGAFKIRLVWTAFLKGSRATLERRLANYPEEYGMPYEKSQEPDRDFAGWFPT